MQDSFKFLKSDIKFSTPIADNFDVIEVPSADSLYLPSDALVEFIARLQVAVDHKTNLTVLRVYGHRTDCLSAYVSFEPSYLRHDVEAHIKELRQLCRKMYAQKSRFVLVTDGDLIGSWFELGLCCSRMIVLNHMARVGFSQLAYGYLPALGSFELNSFYIKAVNKGFWEKGFLWNVLDAPEVISLAVVPIGTSRIDLGNILRFETNRDKLTKSLKNSRSLPFSGDWNGTKHLRKKFAEALWDKFWAQIQKPVESFEFVGLDLVFQSWFEASEHSILSFSASAHYNPASIERLKVGHLEKIWVDISNYLPPIKLVEIWLQTQLQVVFFADSGDRLIFGLRKIYDKLLTTFKKDELSPIWDERVSWFVLENLDAVTPGLQVLRFLLDGSVECMDGRKSVRFIRLATNDFKAKIGTAELPHMEGDSPPKSDDAKWAFGVAFKKIVRTHNISYVGIPASQWLRACFLEELVKEASAKKSGIKDLLKWLATDGWGIVSDESWWASHVVSRFTKWSPEEGTEFFKEFGPREELRDVASWNQILKLIRQHEFELEGSLVSPPRSVPALFSEHMVIFSTLLGLVLYQKKVLGSLVDVDIMVRFSLEVPIRFGSPLGILARFGPQMSREYCDTYFKGWGFGPALDGFFNDRGGSGG